MLLTTSYLKKLPTISTAQIDSLKIETENTRVWLSRGTTQDGEPYNNKVTVETLVDGAWIVTQTYCADNVKRMAFS